VVSVAPCAAAFRQSRSLEQRIQMRLGELRAESKSPCIGTRRGAASRNARTGGLGIEDVGPDAGRKYGETFVAAVILQAVDEGKLDLDSKIERWRGKESWFTNGRMLTT